MKAIFSAVAIAALSALVSSTPLTKRSADGPILTSVSPTYLHIISEAEPNTDQATTFGLNTAIISRTDGSNDIDTLVSFDIPAMSAIAGATASSTCDFFINNAASVNGSQTIQLFTLVSEVDLSQPLTWNTAPSSNQYEGAYFVVEGAATGGSVAIDVFTFPCLFGQSMEFIVRPFGDDVFITWTQGGAGAVPTGAFIEVRN
jgi:Ubiquitin 3 binding protein But2 C-terminal domain